MTSTVANTVDFAAVDVPQAWPGPGDWRVLLDPAGHPFCLTTVTPD